MTETQNSPVDLGIGHSGRLPISDLFKLNLGWGCHASLDNAQKQASARDNGTPLTSYGLNTTGSETLPEEIKIIQIGPREEHSRLIIGNAETLPRIAVDASWTLDTLAAVCQYAAAYIIHEMRGDAQELADILAFLKPLGLISATPQTPKSLRAAFVAAGGEPDAKRVFAYEHYCDRDWWDYTDMRFNPGTGTLTVTPVFFG